jgi:hypothetical protein
MGFGIFMSDLGREVTMTTTIGKVIAFELGILIAIFGWMGFSHMTEETTRRLERLEQRQGSTYGNVSPVYRAQAPAPAVDYRADDEAQPMYTDEPAEVAQYQEPQVVAEPAVEYVQDDYPVARDPSNYIGTFPEPVLGPDYYDYYGYPYGGYAQQTQIVILSNSHCFGRRHFGDHHFGDGGRQVVAPPPRTQRLHPQFPPPRRFVSNPVSRMITPPPRISRPQPHVTRSAPPHRPVTAGTARPSQAVKTSFTR